MAKRILKTSSYISLGFLILMNPLIVIGDSGDYLDCERIQKAYLEKEKECESYNVVIDCRPYDVRSKKYSDCSRKERRYLLLGCECVDELSRLQDQKRECEKRAKDPYFKAKCDMDKAVEKLKKRNKEFLEKKLSSKELTCEYRF